MFDILEKCLESEKPRQVDLVQLRGQKRIITLCSAKNNAVEDLSDISLSGMSAKVLVNGHSWGFSSTNILDAKSSIQTVKDAEKLARAATRGKKETVSYEPYSAAQIDISAPSSKPFKDLSSEEIIKIPLEACKGAQESSSGISLVEANFISIEDEKYFLSSEGSQIRQKISRVMLYVDAIAKRNGDLCPASESIGYTGGLEIFDDFSPYSLGKKVAEKANRLLAAKSPPSGKFNVIIHPTLCATLLHEAIGHPLEADLAMTGGGFSNRINELVSSELITIYDDGQIKGGLGFLPYDDEGIESKRSVLIENGVLKSYMHDRTSSTLSEVPPTGNAHAWDYSVEPLIRQTNIGIEAGDWSMEEMIEDIKEGLLLQGTFGGQANVSADFTFGFQNAVWIRNGQQTEELRGANVAGNAIEVFQTIDAVGQEAVLRPGACGKSQWAIQGRIVPAIRCEIMVGGAGGK
ncbi:MAG: TldD/PmbA family protein [Candidatus Hodarchaeales archaeon]|jgi:TldD protein